MKIELLYSTACSDHVQARQYLREVLAEENVSAAIEEIRVETAEDAKRLQFLGSPTIRIEGMDVEGWSAQPRDYGWRCRTYHDNGQSYGYPSKEMIRWAIQAVQDAEEFGAVGCC